jgi:hypothetical protein
MPINRVNVRTINGAKNNGALPPKFRRVQNRAAAVLDAWDDLGYDIDTLVHLHRLSKETIRADMFGDPENMCKQFDLTKTDGIAKVLTTVLSEIDKGFDPALVSVANNIPYSVVVNLLDDRDHDVEEAASNFAKDMTKKLDEIAFKKSMNFLASIDEMVSEI